MYHNHFMKKTVLDIDIFIAGGDGFYPAQGSDGHAGGDLIRPRGEVLHPLELHAADLEKMKRITIHTEKGDQPAQTYSGVAVTDILEQAGVTLGHQLKGKNMTKYLLVKSGDGYEVIFSLAELDSSFSGKTVLLADQLNGKPLPAGKGPFRLVVPEEKKHARWIWEVRELIVGFAKE